MMASIFKCPACGQMISADVPAGQQVQCPLCNRVVTVPEDVAPFAAVGVATLPPPPMPAGEVSSGMAIAALVCGILGFGCLPAGIVGIVLGIVALVRANRRPNRYGGTGLAIGGICTGGLGLLTSSAMLIAILLPSLSRVRELSKREVCAANLRAIGQAMYLYAQDEEDGAFPDDINRLVKAGYVTAQHFTCPSDVPDSISYHLVPGYNTSSDPTQIIVYEDPSIHGGEGGNVLYQDAHVAFVKSPQLEQLIAAITLPDGRPYKPDDD